MLTGGVLCLPKGQWVRKTLLRSVARRRPYPSCIMGNRSSCFSVPSSRILETTNCVDRGQRRLLTSASEAVFPYNVDDVKDVHISILPKDS